MLGFVQAKLKLTLETINDGLKHLRAADPVMANLIDRVGAFGLRPRRDRFRMLVRAIISQQISTHAARSIRRRPEKLLAPESITAETLARFKPGREKLQHVKWIRGRLSHSGPLSLPRIPLGIPPV